MLFQRDPFGRTLPTPDHPSLRGIVDDVLNRINPLQSQVDDACRTITSSNMATADADIVKVQDQWQPTGFYTPDQMQQGLLFGVGLLTRARDAASSAMSKLQLPEHQELLQAALDEVNVDENSGIDPAKFVTGFQQANAQGIDVIEAQGFKRWVLNVLRASRQARFGIELVSCARPGLFFDVLNAIDAARRALIDLVFTIGAVVKKIGQAVLKIPDLFGSFVTFLKFLPWVVLFGGGYYIAAKHRVIPPRYEPLKIADRTAGRETFRPWRRKAG